MINDWPFGDLKRGHYGVIYADPPWRFEVWNGNTTVKARDSKSTCPSASVHYETMSARELSLLPVDALAAKDCVLFMWITWPTLEQAMDLIKIWGFSYKTCGFCWMKARATQINMFDDEIEAAMGMGYWTRANSEVCLIATKGKPKRLNADVRQGIIAPRREHSRKPEGIHHRIERLVAGPYCELFSRAPQQGWDMFGNETDKFTGETSHGDRWGRRIVNGRPLERSVERLWRDLHPEQIARHIRGIDRAFENMTARWVCSIKQRIDRRKK